MSSRKNLFLTGMVAVVLALAILGAFLAGGLLPVSPQTSPPKTSQQQSQTGTLSVLLTDPPVIPAGVTSVLMTYNSISLHVFGGSSTDWVNVNVSGTVDIMKLINVSKTIAVAEVPTNTYDQVKLEITDIHAIYNSRNISVSLPSREITTTLSQNINVYSSTNVSILIDVQTTLLNVNSDTSPNFVFSATAWSAPVPVNVQSSIAGKVGESTNLSNAKWFNTFKEFYSANLTITSASITSNSLSITVKNVGNASTRLHFVVVNPSSIVSPGNPPRMMPMVIPAFVTVEVFNILPNATLVAFPAVEACLTGCMTEYNSSGYLLPPGQSVTLTYIAQSGTLPLIPSANGEYIITVIGTGAVASTTVKV
ncbi:MAG: DUF4382 domain-containing protein [Conexivisphaerales archaeon]